MKASAINGYTNRICKRLHATPEERILLNSQIDKNFEYAMGRFDGHRDSRSLIREIKRSNGIIPGILKDRPGIFWVKDGATAKLRESVAEFLKLRNLPKLAEDLMKHGLERNKGGLIVDDPATTRFLKGLEKQLVNTDFRKNLAKVLQNY